MPRRGSQFRVWSLRGWRTQLATILIALLFAALVGGLMLRAAAPVVRWRLDRATDRLRIWLSPGRSLLSGYVMRETTWSTLDETVPAAAVLTLQLRPGEIFSAQVAVTGPDPVRRRILAWAPVPPAIASEDETRLALVLHASQALTAVTGAPQGSWQASRPDIVTLRRGVHAASYRLDVVGRSGGHSVWDVQVPALPEVPVVWFGSARGGQVYLTIDDGWFPSQSVLRLMQRDHLPVTAFLIAKAAAEHPDYWRAFIAAGGVIEDHTVSHPDLTRLTLKADVAQWQAPIEDYPDWFGVPAPIFGRPPYGAVDAQVRAAAWAAGLRDIVMWGAEWIPGKGFKTWNGGRIQAGDIILLHWVPGVGQAVAHLLQQLARQDLHPAPLTAGDI